MPSTRIEHITVEVQIPSGEPFADTLAEVMSEIEDGLQRTGLTYRVWTGEGAISTDKMI